MPNKYRRYFLKEKDAKALLSKASDTLGLDLMQVLGNKPNLEAVETDIAEVYLADKKPVLIKTTARLFPTLVFQEFLAHAARAVVDMGAVPFVCKGANVMAPGIRRYEGSFRKGDFLIVVDEKHGKPLAVGEALYDVEETANIKQGAIVKNIHFVGDEIWDLIKQLQG